MWDEGGANEKRRKDKRAVEARGGQGRYCYKRRSYAGHWDTGLQPATAEGTDVNTAKSAFLLVWPTPFSSHNTRPSDEKESNSLAASTSYASPRTHDG